MSEEWVWRQRVAPIALLEHFLLLPSQLRPSNKAEAEKQFLDNCFVNVGFD